MRLLSWLARHPLRWLVPAGLVAFGAWWGLGGQAWLALHTGTDNCVNVPPAFVPVCRYYGFWSGFGSDLGEYVILAALLSHLALLWRSHTCHWAWWCWRHPHFQVGDTPYLVCGRHHPAPQPTVREAVAALGAAGRP